ncbi:MAG: hypothetical protein ACI9IV_001435 [Paracoccaceae bacterium]|jgi:hypothetical protein
MNIFVPVAPPKQVLEFLDGKWIFPRHLPEGPKHRIPFIAIVEM